MPDTTPLMDLPYPLGTDPVRDGDDAIRSLAERIEALIGTPVAGTRTTTTAQSIPNNAWTAATLGVTQDFTGGMVSASGGLGAPVAGWYLASGGFQWDANGTGYRIIELYKNNAAPDDPAGSLARDTRAASGASDAAATVVRPVKLAAGDFVKLRLFQNSGAALSSRITVPAFLSLVLVGRIYV